jgi:hypothetical protein
MAELPSAQHILEQLKLIAGLTLSLRLLVARSMSIFDLGKIKRLGAYLYELQTKWPRRSGD